MYVLKVDNLKNCVYIVQLYKTAAELFDLRRLFLARRAVYIYPILVKAVAFFTIAASPTYALVVVMILTLVNVNYISTSVVGVIEIEANLFALAVDCFLFIINQ